MISDWHIKLNPHGKGQGGILEILSGDEEAALEALEGWAETIDQLAFVPEGLEWQNRSLAVVIGRLSKLCFRMRVESFARETDGGETSGVGYLRAVRV